MLKTTHEVYEQYLEYNKAHFGNSLPAVAISREWFKTHNTTAEDLDTQVDFWSIYAQNKTHFLSIRGLSPTQNKKWHYPHALTYLSLKKIMVLAIPTCGISGGTLLHEMIHMEQIQKGQYPAHGATFVARARKLEKLTGLEIQ